MQGVVRHCVNEASERDIKLTVPIFRYVCRSEIPTLDHFQPFIRQRIAVNRVMTKKDESEKNKVEFPGRQADAYGINDAEIGRASCRERV